MSWLPLVSCILALLASAPQTSRAEETIRLSGRVDRVYTDQFFTINDGRAGGDQAVFIPEPAEPPVRGDRITVTGVMRPFRWATWIDEDDWFRSGWGLLQDVLVKFDGRPVLVADSAVDPLGHDLVRASRGSEPDRPLTGRTRGERKMSARAGGGAGVATAGAGGAGAGATVGAASGRVPSARPRERRTPAGDQPDRRTGESAGELSERDVAARGRPQEQGDDRRAPDRDPGGSTSDPRLPGRPGPEQTRPRTGADRSAAAPSGAMPGAPLPASGTETDAGAQRLVSPGELVTDPRSFSGQDLLVAGTVGRRLDARTVELRSGASGAPLVVTLEDPDVALREGEPILVIGRLGDVMADSDARAGGRVDARGNDRAPAFTGRVLSDAESRARVVAATARAIARDPSLFVGRQVSLVADVAEIVGPRSFLVRGEGNDPRDTVLVVVSHESQMPRPPARVRLFGRVEILQAFNPESRIDPASLEGVDRDLMDGRPVIVADSVTDPDIRPLGR
jgi:hypothetical protein